MAKRGCSGRGCAGLVLCVKYVEWQEKLCLVWRFGSGLGVERLISTICFVILQY